MAAISIDVNDGSFSLRGDIQPLTTDRRARLYLTKYMGASLAELEITVPFDIETQEKTLHEIREMLADYDIKEEISVQVEQSLVQYFEEEEAFAEFSEEARRIRNNELGDQHRQDFAMFTAVLAERMGNRTLYPLQLLSSFHLVFSQNACNFSVPGAGKTSIVYGSFAFLNQLPETDSRHVDKLIVVGPLSSFGPWESEYAECFGRPPSSFRLSGGTSEDARLLHFYGSNPAEISLLSYNALPLLEEDLVRFMSKYPAMVVLDEAHRVKNIQGGIWASCALRLSRYCRSRVVLTGTPAPNGYEDLHNLFKFIWPTRDIIGFHTYQLQDMSSNLHDPRVGQLVRNLSPYFTRIRKSDLGLPNPVEHSPIWVEMGELQREIYDSIESNYMDYLISDGEQSHLRGVFARARVVRLLQASTNPALLRRPLEDSYEDLGLPSDVFVDDTSVLEKILKYEETEVPPKFAAAAKLVSELMSQGQKVIVWAIFIKNILDFQSFLETHGIKSRVLYGATPVERDDLDEDIETRESIVREFHRDDSDFKVLIANPSAISESISLHRACHNSVYLERSFNAANFIQSKDRVHRYGLDQDDQISYYYLLSRNNIDSTVHERLDEKVERMMQIIESEPIPLFRIVESDDGNDEDMRALIENYVRRAV